LPSKTLFTRKDGDPVETLNWAYTIQVFMEMAIHTIYVIHGKDFCFLM